MSKSCFIPRTSLAVFIVFTTQTVFGYTPELNVWKDRQKNMAPARQYASASPLLNEWPTIRPQHLVSSASTRLLKPFSKQKTQTLASLLPHVPSSYGTVQQVTMPDSGVTQKTILHIQDIHLNAEAQNNIGNTVKALLESKKVDMVFLEGAFGPVALEKFAEFPDQRAIGAAANYLLQENKISGAVHALLVNGSIAVPTVGVDDEAHYNANVQAVRDAFRLKANVNEQLEAAQEKLQNEKAQLFNSALKAFDAHVEAYRTAHEKIGPYVDYLVKQVGPPSHNTEVFLAAWRAETTMDFPRVEAARNRLVNDLMHALSKDQVSELLNLSVAYRVGDLPNADFYAALKRLCQSSGVALERYPAMNAYVQYIFLSDAINGEKLFEDVAQMEDGGYAKLAKTPAEKNLVAQSKWLRLAHKLVDFSLTKAEWSEYKGRGGEFAPFEAFYREAEARDAAMTKNVLAAMNAQGAHTAILITGGFHTSGMQALLKKSGVASVSFKPKISKVDSENGSAYLSVFTQEKTPLDRLFEGETLFLPPHTAQIASVGLLSAIATEAAQPHAPLTPQQIIALRKIGLPAGTQTSDGTDNTVNATLPNGTKLIAQMTTAEYREFRALRLAQKQNQQERSDAWVDNFMAGLMVVTLLSFVLPPMLRNPAKILWMGGFLYLGMFGLMVLVVGVLFIRKLNIKWKADIIRPIAEELVFSGLPLLFIGYEWISKPHAFTFYFVFRVAFVVWHIFDEGLPKTPKELFERVFLPVVISGISMLTFPTNPFYWAVASHIVLNMMTEKLESLFGLLGIEFSPEKANLGPLLPLNNFTTPLAKHTKPFQDVALHLDGRTLTPPGLLVPKNGYERINERQAMNVVLDAREGGRVFLVKDKVDMTYLTVHIMNSLMNLALRPYALGLATGGTQDEPRWTLGMPEFARRVYGNLVPDFSRVSKWGTLDDYFWRRQQTLPGQNLDYKLSSYRSEGMYMLLRNLYPHLTDEQFLDYFVTPMPGETPEEVAQKWREALKVFDDPRYQMLWQLGGIGTSSHFAFVETSLEVLRRAGRIKTNWFKFLGVKPSSFRKVKLEYGPMSEDGLYPLLDITKVQNAGYWVPQKFHAFFLRFMGERRIGDLPSALLLLSTMSFEDINKKYKEEKFRFRDVEHFRQELKNLYENYGKVPDVALSQGVAGVLRRTNHKDSFNITTVEGPHKQTAVQQMLDTPPGMHSSAGLRHHLARKSIVIVTENAADKINTNRVFRVEPINSERRILTTDNLQEEWSKTLGGKEYNALMEQRRRNIITPGAFWFWKHLEWGPGATFGIAAVVEGALAGAIIYFTNGATGVLWGIVIVNLVLHAVGVAVYNEHYDEFEFNSLLRFHEIPWKQYLFANTAAFSSLLPAFLMNLGPIDFFTCITAAIIPHLIINLTAVFGMKGGLETYLAFFAATLFPFGDLKANSPVVSSIGPAVTESQASLWLSHAVEVLALLLFGGLFLIGAYLIVRRVWKTIQEYFRNISGGLFLAALLLSSGGVNAQDSLAVPPVAKLAKQTSSVHEQMSARVEKILRKLVDLIEKDHWLPADTSAKVLPLLKDVIVGNKYRFVPSSENKSGSPLYTVGDTIFIDEGAFPAIPSAALFGILLHEIVHTSAMHKARSVDPENVEIVPEQGLNAKRAIAKRAVSEWEAILIELAFYEAQAKYLQEDTSMFLSALSMEIPQYAETYENFARLTRGDYDAQTVLLRHVVPTHIGSRDFLRSFALHEKADVSTPEKLDQWLLSWLNDPAYYNFAIVQDPVSNTFTESGMQKAVEKWRGMKERGELNDDRDPQIIWDVLLKDDGGMFRLQSYKGRLVYWLGGTHGHPQTIEAARLLTKEMEQYADRGLAFIEERQNEANKDSDDSLTEWGVLLNKAQDLNFPIVRSLNPLSPQAFEQTLASFPRSDQGDLIAAAFLHVFYTEAKEALKNPLMKSLWFNYAFRAASTFLSEAVGKSEVDIVKIAFEAMVVWLQDSPQTSTEKINHFIDTFLDFPNKAIHDQLRQTILINPTAQVVFAMTGAAHVGSPLIMPREGFKADDLQAILKELVATDKDKLMTIFSTPFPGVTRDPTVAPIRAEDKAAHMGWFLKGIIGVLAVVGGLFLLVAWVAVLVFFVFLPIWNWAKSGKKGKGVAPLLLASLLFAAGANAQELATTQMAAIPIPSTDWFITSGATLLLLLYIRHRSYSRKNIVPQSLMFMGDRIVDATRASIHGGLPENRWAGPAYYGGLVPINAVGVGDIDGLGNNGYFNLRSNDRKLLLKYVRNSRAQETKKISLAEARRIVLGLHKEEYQPLSQLFPSSNVGLDINVREPRDIPAAVATVRRVFGQLSPQAKVVVIAAPREAQTSWENALKSKLGPDILKRIIFLPRQRHTYFVKTEYAKEAFDAGAFLASAQTSHVRNLVLAIRGEYVLDPVARQKYQAAGVLSYVAFIVDYLNEVMAYKVRDTLPVKHLDHLARAIAQSA